MQGVNLAPAIVFDGNRRLLASAPYSIDFRILKAQFANNAARLELYQHLIAWLQLLDKVVDVEFIWIGGSYVTLKPNPSDVDAVVFYRYARPDLAPAERDNVLRANAPLLNHNRVEERFRIDSALVPLDVDVAQLIHASAYWAMVFSNDERGGRRAFYTLKWDPNLEL